MQPKQKVYLPTSYQQYLQTRKKNRSVPTPQTRLPPTEPSLPPAPLPASQVQQQQTPKEKVIIEKVLHSDYKLMFDEFKNNRFHQIKGKIQQQLQKLRVSPPINIPSVSEILNAMQIQSLENINTIRQQFKLQGSKRNIDKLQKMLNFNKFFVILNRQKRWKIFQHAAFQQHEAGKRIFSMGDTDQWMYVIIKGCVKQYEEKETSFNAKMLVNFTSHYQGANFGEVQVYPDNQTKGKRYHSVQATQKCYLLKIANSFYRDLISNSAQDDFQKKLNALMESTIFKQTSKMMVTPLLSTLQKHVLPYGKVLIRQGEQVRRLYFVAQGNLNVIYLDRARRSIKHMNIQQKPQGFHVSRPTTQSKSRKNKNYSIHSTFYYPETQDSSKQFIYGKKKLLQNTNQIQYNDQVLFRQLRTGDFFGGKSFLSQIDRQKKQQVSQFFFCSLEARLSIISSSTQSIVYSIDQKKFFSLSQTLQKLIIKGIRQQGYFDQYNIEEKLRVRREWKVFAEKEVAKIIGGKKNRSHSFRN